MGFLSHFTALAGNPAINGADEDIVMVFLAVSIGFALGRVLRNSAFGRRLVPQAPRVVATLSVHGHGCGTTIGRHHDRKGL